MNTFLPTNDFEVIGYILDPKRLNRQISECVWIAKALAGHSDNETISKSGKAPVLKLWQDLFGDPLIGWLRVYQKALHEIWRKMYSTHAAVTGNPWMDDFIIAGEQPRWPDSVHASHRASLIQKDPSYYRPAFIKFGLPAHEEFNGYAWLSPRTDIGNKTCFTKADLPHRTAVRKVVGDFSISQRILGRTEGEPGESKVAPGTAPVELPGLPKKYLRDDEGVD